jgi:hypothetical protein
MRIADAVKMREERSWACARKRCASASEDHTMAQMMAVPRRKDTKPLCRMLGPGTWIYASKRVGVDGCGSVCGWLRISMWGLWISVYCPLLACYARIPTLIPPKTS